MLTDIFPPVLDSKGEAVLIDNSIDDFVKALTNKFRLVFYLPDSVDINSIGHIQIVIKNKENGRYAIDSHYSPDYQTLFLPFDTKYVTYTSNNRIMKVEFPQQFFSSFLHSVSKSFNGNQDGFIIAQIRFGINKLWTYIGSKYKTCYFDPIDLFNLGSSEESRFFKKFSEWKKENVESQSFGEWSNIQTIYLYQEKGTAKPKKGQSVLPSSFDFNFKIASLEKLTPKVTFTYKSNTGRDSIVDCKIKYTYKNYEDFHIYSSTEDPNKTNISEIQKLYKTNMIIQNGQIIILGKTVTKTVSGGKLNSSKEFEFTYEIPVARYGIIAEIEDDEETEKYIQEEAKVPFAIKATCEAVTANNVTIRKTVYIDPIFYNYFEENKSAYSGEIENIEIIGDEMDDGIISKKVTLYDSDETQNVTVYRMNSKGAEVIKIKEGINYSSIIKDFTVEAGEKYRYIAVREETGKNARLLCDPYLVGCSGYLSNMDSSYLIDSERQLRVQGNVSISNFKKNVSESFQTTIGSRYPYFVKGSQIDYRTFTLNGIISINFDPTATFLQYDASNNRSTYKEISLDNNLFFGDFLISNSRIRVKEKNNQYILEYPYYINADQASKESSLLKNLIRGPASIYYWHYHNNIMPIIPVDRTDNLVFIERKFREAAMDWLSNGYPKLFRSETEGNMIVMLSGVSFTPFDKGGRMIYSFSATVTEIAEYNLENLKKYNLIANNISVQPRLYLPKYATTKDFFSEEARDIIIAEGLLLNPKIDVSDGFIEHKGEVVKYKIKNNYIEKVQDIILAIVNKNPYGYLPGKQQVPIYDDFNREDK